jgi:DNA-binding IscR family transcriptional regulator
MPMTWTEPKIAIQHNGVTVYHTYKSDQCTSEHWYTLHEYNDDSEGWYPEGDGPFDIRDLEVDISLSVHKAENHRAILKAAIEAGLLVALEGEEATPTAEEPATVETTTISIVDTLRAVQKQLPADSCVHGDEPGDPLPDPVNCLNCQVNALLLEIKRHSVTEINRITRLQFIEAAREQYRSDDIEIDDDAVLSETNADPAFTWVSAWVCVYHEDIKR